MHAIWRFSTPARVRREVFFLSLVSLVSILLWAERFSIYRYLVPLEMIGPPVLWSTTFPWGKSFRKQWMALVSLLVLWSFWTTSTKSWRRTPWNEESHFGVEMPSWNLKPSSLVVFLERTPLGYLASSIPHTTPIVRLTPFGDPVRDPEFPGPDHNETLLGRRVRERIARTPPADIYVFAHVPPRGGVAFGTFGLAVDQATCKRFRPRLERQPIFRCQLRAVD